MTLSSPVLVGIDVAGVPDAWRAAGFLVDPDGGIRIGHVRMQTDVGARGIAAWTFAGGVFGDEIDGLSTRGSVDGPCTSAEHPNGATLIDHIVLFSPDGDRTTAALEAVGLQARRRRDIEQYGAQVRQTFFRSGEVIVELVGPQVPSPEGGRTRFFGLAITVADLDVCAHLLGSVLGSVKEAVQSGRRIATLRHKELDLSVAIAFMSA